MWQDGLLRVKFRRQAFYLYVYRTALKGLRLIISPSTYRKYFQAAYNHLDEQNKTPSVISTDWENDSPEGGAGPVPVHLFPKHVSRLHADSDIGFSKEYEAIQTQTLLDGYTADFSQQTENKDKNRYLNIVACECSILVVHCTMVARRHELLLLWVDGLSYGLYASAVCLLIC